MNNPTFSLDAVQLAIRILNDYEEEERFDTSEGHIFYSKPDKDLVAIPNRDPLDNGIIIEIADQMGITKDDFIQQINLILKMKESQKS